MRLPELVLQESEGAVGPTGVKKTTGRPARWTIRIRVPRQESLCLMSGCFRGPEMGLLPPWSGDVNETTTDTQEDAGTSEGQTHTTGELGCYVPGHMQGLQIHIHWGDMR